MGHSERFLEKMFDESQCALAAKGHSTSRLLGLAGVLHPARPNGPWLLVCRGIEHRRPSPDSSLPCRRCVRSVRACNPPAGPSVRLGIAKGR